jgi:hypothetical protein
MRSNPKLLLLNFQTIREELMLPKVPSPLLRRRRVNSLMPRRPRISKSNSIKLREILRETTRLLELKRRLLRKLRRRRQRTKKNSMTMRINAPRSNLRLLLLQLLSMMLPPHSRTKENTKFKSPT